MSDKNDDKNTVYVTKRSRPNAFTSPRLVIISNQITIEKHHRRLHVLTYAFFKQSSTRSISPSDIRHKQAKRNGFG